MNWYYAIGTERQGPVSDEQLHAWAKDGVVTGETLVWREGLTNWQPYRTVLPPGAVPPAPPVAPAPEPAPAVAPPAPVPVATTWYYAIGTDRLGPVSQEQLQALVKDGVVTGETLVWREGLPNWLPYRTQAAPGPATATVNFAAPLPEDWRAAYDPAFGETFEAGVAYVGRHGGAAFLAFLPAAVLIFVLQLFQVVPFVGWLLAALAGLLVNAALVGGMWRVSLAQMRGTDRPDVFSGFRRGYFHLTVGPIVRAFLAGLSVLPGLCVIGIAVAVGLMSGSGWVVGGGMLAGGLAVFIGLFVTVFLLVRWAFLLPLVADKDLSFWAALQFSRRAVAGHWWATLLLVAALSFVTFVPLMIIDTAISPAVDFRDFKDLMEAAKAGKLALSPAKAVLVAGLNTFWCWLVSPLYFGVMGARYREIFDRPAEPRVGG
jgi:hypothetical protein